jgi:hypothetical protein
MSFGIYKSTEVFYSSNNDGLFVLPANAKCHPMLTSIDFNLILKGYIFNLDAEDDEECVMEGYAALQAGNCYVYIVCIIYVLLAWYHIIYITLSLVSHYFNYFKPGVTLFLLL